MPTFTPQAFDLLKSLEGLRLAPYQDDAGVWTIGYGHTGRDISPVSLWTPEYAEATLICDLGGFIGGVTALVQRPNVPLTDNQFSALVIFAFNVGLGALGGSTVLRQVNACLDAMVPGSLAEWCHIHKAGAVVVDPGLQRRRQAEINLWRS